MQQTVGNRATREELGLHQPTSAHRPAQRLPFHPPAHRPPNSQHSHPPAGHATPRRQQESEATGEHAGPDALSDIQAGAQAAAELRDPGEAFSSPRVEAVFDAPESVDLQIPQDGQKSKAQSGDPRAPIQQAQAGYSSFIANTQRLHDSVKTEANSIIDSLNLAAGNALRQIDSSTQACLAAEGSAVEAARGRLEETTRAALSAIEAQGLAARRQIGGAVILARRRVDAAAAAAEAQLPPIRSGLITRFTALYEDGAKEVGNSSKHAAETLRSDARKTSAANAIPATDDPELGARVEAKRNAIPGLLDHLAQDRENNGLDYSAQIRARLDHFPLVENQYSILQHIEGFVASLRLSVTGGSAQGQTVQSLRDSGHHAVDAAQTRALGALHDQLRAARETVRQIQHSGMQNISAQRTAGIRRVSEMRTSARNAVNNTRAQAVQGAVNAAQTGLSAYPNSAKQLAAALRDAAGKSANVLTHTAMEAFPRVTQTLTDARDTQTLRLHQAGDSAQTSITDDGTSCTVQAAAAENEFESALNTQMERAAANAQQLMDGQKKGLEGLAGGVATAAQSYTEPLSKMFQKAIAGESDKLNPTFASELAHVSQVTIEQTALDQTKVRDPLADPNVAQGLESAGSEIDKRCTEWANQAKGALFDGLTTNEDGLMAALRAHTRAQEASIEKKYQTLTSGSNLRTDIEHDHDRTFGGLNDDQYHACLNYLNGNAGEGAKAELASTVHWYGGEGEHAEQVMRALTVEQQRDVGTSEVANRVRGSLYGTDLNVFNALAEANSARADAYRLREKIDQARQEGDTEAEVQAFKNYTGGADPQSAAQHLLAVQREFAHIQGLDAQQHTVSDQEAQDALAAYATQPATVYTEEGSAYTVALSKPDAVLIEQVARHGVDSPEGRAARMLREGESGDTPNFTALEAAVVDPRLNPALQATLTPQQRNEQRAQAVRDQQAMFAAYAQLAQTYGLGHVENAEQARQLAAERLVRSFDATSEKGQAGLDYARSIITQDVPDGAAGMRYAMLGLGTDEDMIHRNLQRMSRQDVERMRITYQDRYHSDLYADLGVYGQGSFGELSGDDRLKAEVELMGVPQNDRERAEVARYRQIQQRNETGSLGSWWNEGSAEDRALKGSEDRLQSMIGGQIQRDEFGRPVIQSNKFDENGRYVGPDRDRFDTEVNLSQAVAENYAARIDRLTNYVTTAIAIIGAVAATIATGGAGAPLLAMAIAGGAGLLSMGVSYAMKGGRYGWEQALTDLGMTAVQVVTAGVGQQLGAAAKVGTAGAEAAELAEAVEGTAVRTAAASQASGGLAPLSHMMKTGAITGAIGSFGSTALNEHTWDKGFLHGLGEVAQGTGRGALGGAMTALIAGGLERIPAGGGSRLGEILNETSVKGQGIIGGGLRMAGSGVARGTISSLSSMGGRASEIGFDALTGKYHGDLHGAIAQTEEAGWQPLLQGFAEGAGQTIYRPQHDTAQPRQRTAEPELTGAQRPVRTAPAAGETEPARTPSVEAPPEMPAAERSTTAEGESQAPPPGGRGPNEPGGGSASGRGPEDDRLFPGLTDAEIDAAFEQMTSGPFIQRSGPEEGFDFRTGKGQQGYWGTEPDTGMTVQEYRFPARRALPALDAQGRPMANAKPDLMTRMRVHSPHLDAPPGSPSREGWTVNIEQGNARMLSDGSWFDTRYGTAPDGARVKVEPFRRGPNNEWIEQSSGREVTDPRVLGALENWDANMRDSHIPLFPEGGSRRAPSGGPPDPVGGEAAGVGASRFQGEVKGSSPVTSNEMNRAIERLADPGGLLDGQLSQSEENPFSLRLKTESGQEVSVRVEMGHELQPDENGVRPFAQYQQSIENPNEYVVRVGNGSPGEFAERGILHELTEIAAVHNNREAQGPDALGTRATAARLSGHDAARLAELGWIAREMLRPGASPERLRGLMAEAQYLAAHLGVTGEGPNVSRRLSVLNERIGTSPERFLLEIARNSARENPFLKIVPNERLGALTLLGERLDAARQMGLPQGELKALTEQIQNQARQVLLEQDLLIPQRAKGAGTVVLDNQVQALRARLSGSALEVFDEGLKLATFNPRLTVADLDVADRFTVDAVRAAFQDREMFQDWSKFRDLRLARYPDTASDPKAMLRLFRAWARGSYIPEDSKSAQPRSLSSDVDRPDPGYEHQYLVDPEVKDNLLLPNDRVLRIEWNEKLDFDGKPGPVTRVVLEFDVMEGVTARNELLAEAETLRQQLEDAKAKNADSATIQALKDEIQERMSPVRAFSEAFGVAAGRAFANSEWAGGRILEIPRSGAGVPDLLYETPDGRLIVIECKGGDAELGTRDFDGIRVEQGRPEYLRSLANEMITKSKDPLLKAYGQRMLDELKSKSLEYWHVQQRFDDTGMPLPPEVAKFDLDPTTGGKKNRQ
jgi:hypothetical protein